jgi:hypothetical protein
MVIETCTSNLDMKTESKDFPYTPLISERGNLHELQMMEVKQVGSYAGKPGLPARCEQAHAAGTGSFTPERRKDNRGEGRLDQLHWQFG